MCRVCWGVRLPRRSRYLFSLSPPPTFLFGWHIFLTQAFVLCDFCDLVSFFLSYTHIACFLAGVRNNGWFCHCGPHHDHPQVKLRWLLLWNERLFHRKVCSSLLLAPSTDPKTMAIFSGLLDLCLSSEAYSTQVGVEQNFVPDFWCCSLFYELMWGQLGCFTNQSQ